MSKTISKTRANNEPTYTIVGDFKVIDSLREYTRGKETEKLILFEVQKTYLKPDSSTETIKLQAQILPGSTVVFHHSHQVYFVRNAVFGGRSGPLQISVDGAWVNPKPFKASAYPGRASKVAGVSQNDS